MSDDPFADALAYITEHLDDDPDNRNLLVQNETVFNAVIQGTDDDTLIDLIVDERKLVSKSVFSGEYVLTSHPAMIHAERIARAWCMRHKFIPDITDDLDRLAWEIGHTGWMTE